MSTPLCLMCVKRKAKFLASVQDRRGSAKGPRFCSKSCAARYGLMQVDDDRHWCPNEPKEDKVVFSPQYDCYNKCKEVEDHG